MGRLLIALAVTLVLAGCDLGDGSPEEKGAMGSRATTTALAPTPTRPRPSQTELIIRAIRSCEVKRIFFGHDDTTLITYRGGRTVHTKRLHTKDIERAAWEHAAACNILIVIE
jgi:hypothetical protein